MGLRQELARAIRMRDESHQDMLMSKNHGFGIGPLLGWTDAVIEIGLIEEKLTKMNENEKAFRTALSAVSEDDLEGLENAFHEYGDSWCQRGSQGAYFTLVRPLDRFEMRVARPASNRIPYDIFQHVLDDKDGTGFLDSLRDLRRYLMLVEVYLLRQGHVLPKQRHNKGPDARAIMRAEIGGREDLT